MVPVFMYGSWTLADMKTKTGCQTLQLPMPARLPQYHLFFGGRPCSVSVQPAAQSSEVQGMLYSIPSSVFFGPNGFMNRMLSRRVYKARRDYVLFTEDTGNTWKKTYSYFFVKIHASRKGTAGPSPESIKALQDALTECWGEKAAHIVATNTDGDLF
jgi:hypothetical protein